MKQASQNTLRLDLSKIKGFVLLYLLIPILKNIEEISKKMKDNYCFWKNQV
jgi:hypothetical protein